MISVPVLAASGLGQIIAWAGGGPATPDDTVWHPTSIGLAVAGIMMKLGARNTLNTLQFIIDFIRFEGDLWKQIECNSYQFQVDILDFLPGKFAQFLDAKGVSSYLIDDGKELLKKLLQAGQGEKILNAGKELIS